MARSLAIPGLVLGLWMSAPAWAQTAGAARFLPLGDLPDGRGGSAAYAISPDGSAVVGVSDSPAGLRAFLWTESRGMVPLRRRDGSLLVRSLAHAVTPGGAFVVGVAAPGAIAYRWSASTGARSLGFLPGATLTSQAYGISNDGSVVVGTSALRGFRWTPVEGIAELGVCAGSGSSEARGVSADGTVVAGFCNGPRGFEAARWTAADGMVSLGPLSAEFPEGQAYGISADGAVIVGGAWQDEADGGSRAFLWTREQGMTGIDACFGAWDVSANGSVVLAQCGASGDIWDAAHGPRSLRTLLEGAGIDLSAWRSIAGTAVSDDGHVFAGTGTHPDGTLEAFLAELPADSDGDGVLDADDLCPGTRAGDPVEPDSGCSVPQRCPCAAHWRSHGEYLQCIQRASGKLVRLGAMTRAERRELQKAATGTSCGRRR